MQNAVAVIHKFVLSFVFFSLNFSTVFAQRLGPTNFQYGIAGKFSDTGNPVLNGAIVKVFVEEVRVNAVMASYLAGDYVALRALFSDAEDSSFSHLVARLRQKFAKIRGGSAVRLLSPQEMSAFIDLYQRAFPEWNFFDIDRIRSDPDSFLKEMKAWQAQIRSAVNQEAAPDVYRGAPGEMPRNFRFSGEGESAKVRRPDGNFRASEDGEMLSKLKADIEGFSDPRVRLAFAATLSLPDMSPVTYEIFVKCLQDVAATRDVSTLRAALYIFFKRSVLSSREAYYIGGEKQKFERPTDSFLDALLNLSDEAMIKFAKTGEWPNSFPFPKKVLRLNRMVERIEEVRAASLRPGAAASEPLEADRGSVNHLINTKPRAFDRALRDHWDVSFLSLRILGHDVVRELTEVNAAAMAFAFTQADFVEYFGADFIRSLLKDPAEVERIGLVLSDVEFHKLGPLVEVCIGKFGK